ncbi:MAG TPA: ribbon-helix-helix protein, CopG family [Tepidiformaceae bacterium]|nr:ribbon-helix-helix protein, CopG family [Tepidiformaceae bacterium]
MRTTIELSDDTLRALRELAARRGEKGYSKIIAEALEAYFAAPSTLAEAHVRYDARPAKDDPALAPLRRFAPGTHAAHVLRDIIEARQRPEGGYSREEEAALIEFAMRNPGETDEVREAWLRSFAGSITEDEAEQWKAEIRESRKNWRTP